MRGAAAALLVLLVGAWAHAADDAVERARALAPDDPGAAAEVLRGVLADPASAPAVRVAAARAALDDLPQELGHPVAAGLVLSVLRGNRSHPAAWRAAFDVRDSVLAGLDLSTGVPFLRDMIALYPAEVIFRHHMVDLLVEAGRPEEARAECEAILRSAQDDVRSRYVLALLDELDGDPRAAVRRYEEIIAISGDLRAHELRVKLLWDTLRDFDAAALALADAWLAVRSAPAGEERDLRWANLENEERYMNEERATRDALRDADSRLTRILAAIGAGWVLALGGGLALLRRRGLV